MRPSPAPHPIIFVARGKIASKGLIRMLDRGVACTAMLRDMPDNGRRGQEQSNRAGHVDRIQN
jgi:hypothetical protein